MHAAMQTVIGAQLRSAAVEGRHLRRQRRPGCCAVVSERAGANAAHPPPLFAGAPEQSRRVLLASTAALPLLLQSRQVQAFERPPPGASARANETSHACREL